MCVYLMTEGLIVADCFLGKGVTCKKLWLAMMRVSWAPSSSGCDWLLLIPCTNWGMLSATACNETHQQYILHIHNITITYKRVQPEEKSTIRLFFQS